MRIILYTGKGGVGKTSVAASTALRCAQMGYRTVVLSTDAAHSLSDSFDIPLGDEPVKVADNLWGQEVETIHEVETHWGTLQEYATTVFAWRGMDKVLAEEMTVFPGMEEIASLLRITDHYDSGKYDVIIVDCAPTGETLRLLSFPDVATWWLEKIFPFERKAASLVRPMLKTFTSIPIPDDHIFDLVKRMILRLSKMHDLLADQDLSSVRLVLNPEKMVIKEAQRTYTYLNLFGYTTDAIVCNRLIPDTVQDAYFSAWKEKQVEYKQLVEECFAPLPILGVPLFDREVVGLEMLERMGLAVFGDNDPTRYYFKGRNEIVEPRGDDYVLSLPLPLAHRDEIQVLRDAGEITVQVGKYRRNLLLPRILIPLDVQGARFHGDRLEVTFRASDEGQGARSKGQGE